jgi:hypothetical protein
VRRNKLKRREKFSKLQNPESYWKQERNRPKKEKREMERNRKTKRGIKNPKQVRENQRISRKRGNKYTIPFYRFELSVDF